MPETSLEIPVSFREIDRARLIQAVALDRSGKPIEDLQLTVEVDENGTLHFDDGVRLRQLTTGSNGAVYFTWWPWPRFGPSHDRICQVRASWEQEGVIVYLEDLRE
jgi:hypothetical protein